HPHELVGGGEDGRQARHLPAVVLHRLHGRLDGVAGGDGGRQDQHVPAPHHGGDVVPQDDLAARGVLGGDDVDGLVGIHVAEAVLGQLVGHTGADHLGAVQAQDGVHDGGALVHVHQLFGGLRRFGQAGLLHGHVNVIVDVAVAGGEVPPCDAQDHPLVVGGQLYHVDHFEDPSCFFGFGRRASRWRVKVYLYCSGKSFCTQYTYFTNFRKKFSLIYCLPPGP